MKRVGVLKNSNSDTKNSTPARSSYGTAEGAATTLLLLSILAVLVDTVRSSTGSDEVFGGCNSNSTADGNELDDDDDATTAMLVLLLLATDAGEDTSDDDNTRLVV